MRMNLPQLKGDHFDECIHRAWLRRHSRVHGLLPPQYGAYTRQGFAQIEGFRDIVIRSPLQAYYPADVVAS